MSRGGKVTGRSSRRVITSRGRMPKGREASLAAKRKTGTPAAKPKGSLDRARGKPLSVPYGVLRGVPARRGSENFQRTIGLAWPQGVLLNRELTRTQANRFRGRASRESLGTSKKLSHGEAYALSDLPDVYLVDPLAGPGRDSDRSLVTIFRIIAGVDGPEVLGSSQA